jgi:KDO2-lipid IV(A) lauroyltransferase
MYYLLLILLYPLSLLPLRMLYLLSDLFFFILYRLTNYRKDVVMDNLRHAFPERSQMELNRIMKDFYKCFCDQWIETIKLLGIPEAELRGRVQGNWEIFKELDAEDRNCYALLGHNFNWEWANVACQYNSPQQFAGVYLPLENKAVDRIMKKIRTRSGSWLISMKAQKSGFQQLRDVRYIVGLIADQNPSVVEVADWKMFLNREAPFFRGPEQLARRSGSAVIFAGISKIKRGHYSVSLEKFTNDASKLSQGEILNAYVSFLERRIKSQPENYMWTHRRWKYKRTVVE